MKTLIIVPLLALVACSGGPDPVRLRAERAGYHLALRCANGWFINLPYTADDERLVRKSLTDWDTSLAADERLLASPIGTPADPQPPFADPARVPQ
jgi:hypothetical protein